MNDVMDVIEIARAMIFRHGIHAAFMMDKQAQDNIEAGDLETGTFWARVAQAVRALGDKPGTHHRQAPTAFFGPAFKATPHPYLLLAPNLDIAGANDAYLAVAMMKWSDLAGCYIFDVFPDNPDNPEANGVASLSASLARVLDHAHMDRMEPLRYDVRRPDGRFQEKWWRPLNIPVFNDDGQLAHILHHVEDITEAVLKSGTGCSI